MEKKVSINEFERMVFELEGVRVAIRTNRTHIDPYDFKRKSKGEISVLRFLKSRVLKFMEEDESVSIVKGNGTDAYFFESLDDIRKTYKV